MAGERAKGAASTGWLKVDPQVDPLRAVKLAALVRRIGL
jgi:hypothetical protein